MALTVHPALAGNAGTFARAFNPETAAGFTNTFTPPTTVLNPKCPNGIAGTPGSDPANKVLNTTLNMGATTFAVGSTVHYTYTDNPHGAAFGFDIQDCEVVYPPGFFSASDFDPTTGVLINPLFTKALLDANGTMVDGAEFDGISNPEGNIYFSWTVQPAAPGSWICNFARDINTDHGGGGNRKVTPTCFEVGTTTTKPAVFAGYTDSFRKTEGPTHPSPWAGDMNANNVTVTFVGCPAPGSPCDASGVDAGAIRIDNPSTTDTMTVQMSNATVTIAGPSGTCTYTPWQNLSPVSVPAGGTIIMTETGSASTFVSPCGDVSATPLDNFDTSEANDVTNPGGACTAAPTSVIPQVSLTISEGGGSPTTFTYSDTHEALNTQGTDLGQCPAGTSEEQDWTTLS